jgi:hypothetical protein
MMSSRPTTLAPTPNSDFEKLEMSAVKALAGLEGLSLAETCNSIDHVALMMMEASPTPDPEADATRIVDVSLKDFPTMVVAPKVTPPPSPTPNSEASSPDKVHPTPRASSKPKKASLVPTKNDPMDPSFLMTLHSDEDHGKINAAHVAIRRDVLDVRRTMSGRIYLQCSYCKHLPRDERAKCSTVAPQTVEGLYRGMVRFVMNHINECEHVPLKIKAKSPKHINKAAKAGIKRYWVESAHALGLFDGEGGIIYCPEVASPLSKL